MQNKIVKLSFLLRNRYTDGRPQPVYVKVYYNGASRFLPTEIEITADQWQQESELIINRSDSRILNLRLEALMTELEEKVNNIPYLSSMNAQDIVDILSGKGGEDLSPSKMCLMNTSLQHVSNPQQFACVTMQCNRPTDRSEKDSKSPS